MRTTPKIRITRQREHNTLNWIDEVGEPIIEIIENMDLFKDCVRGEKGERVETHTNLKMGVAKKWGEKGYIQVSTNSQLHLSHAVDVIITIGSILDASVVKVTHKFMSKTYAASYIRHVIKEKLDVAVKKRGRELKKAEAFDMFHSDLVDQLSKVGLQIGEDVHVSYDTDPEIESRPTMIKFKFSYGLNINVSLVGDEYNVERCYLPFAPKKRNTILDRENLDQQVEKVQQSLDRIQVVFDTMFS